MIETVINLKPESEWPAGMTVDDLIGKLDSALQFPGVSNAWTMPIRARIDMLSTGIRTPIGIKLFGRSYEEMDRVAKQIEAVVRKVPGTTSAFAERVIGSYYLNIEPDREEIVRLMGNVQPPSRFRTIPPQTLPCGCRVCFRAIQAYGRGSAEEKRRGDL